MFIIGEKLNCSLSEAAEAISGRNKEKLLGIAESQIRGGAECLDINTAVTSNEEKDALWTIETIRSHTDTSICIDTENPSLMIKAAKLCDNRKLIFNSITYDEKFRPVIDYAAEYRIPVIAMAIPMHSSLPYDSKSRFKLISELVCSLVANGLQCEQIYADMLCLSCASDPDSGRTMLETLALTKKNLPDLKTVAGISNFSCGLPNRPTITSALLAMAVHAGLDAVIADSSEPMISRIAAASKAICDSDNLNEYICKMRNQKHL